MHELGFGDGREDRCRWGRRQLLHRATSERRAGRRPEIVHIVLRTSAGARDLEVSGALGRASLGDLLTAAGLPREAGVLLDGRSFGPDVGLDEMHLYEGALLDAGTGGAASRRSVAALELWVIAGLDAGHRMPLDRPVELGRGAGCQLVVRGPRVSRRHCLISPVGGGTATVTDLGSANGTWVDGAQVTDATAVEPGSVIDLGGDVAVTVVRAGGRRDILRPDLPSPEGRVPLHRPPRSRPRLAEVAIEAPQPPPEPRPVRFSYVSAVAPLVLGLVMVIALHNALYALFTLLSPVMVVGSWWENRRRTAQEGRWQNRQFADGLTRFGSAVDSAQQARRAYLRESLPDAGETLFRATVPSSRLWERRAGEEDFLALTAGLADVTRRPALADRSPAEERVAQMLAARELIASVPVPVNLDRRGVVGIVGPREAAAAVARWLVCQATVLHGPADLRVAVFTDPRRVRDWEWSKWLPHVRDPAGGADTRLLAAGEQRWDELLERLTQADDSAPAGVLAVIDGNALIDGRDAWGRVLMRNAEHPSGIVIADSTDRLPAVCTAVLELAERPGESRLERPREGETVERLLPCGLSTRRARDCALALARFEDPELRQPGGSLPDRVALLPLLGLEPPGGPAIVTRWRRSHHGASLAAPIGIGEPGPFALDLVTDGPHGLVAGTTGAGKSELLRTLTVSMAATYGPAELNFVLIDYKGGGAFGECADLPHTVGMVTDLDEELGERALKSLEAELRHRERILRDHGGDISRYSELVRSGAAAPLARLVVIIDEFATLAVDLPDFVSSLVGVAQRGRSLGVHLLLATQRPSGAVDQNIRANTNLRICLRVQTPQDSADVIDSPAAATIGRDLPGRAYVRLGPSELIPVQAALVTAASAASGGTALRVAPFTFVAGPVEEEAKAAARSDLSALSSACREAARSMRIPLPRRPWLDPLPDQLDLFELAGSERTRALSGEPTEHPPFALADDPDVQSQYPVAWDLSAGNLILYGIVGSGTTTALSSLALALARARSPDELHVYALDFQAGGLAELAGLPHTGAVIAGSDHERQRRLLSRLRGELERRRMEAGRRATGPSIVLLVDSYGGFAAEHSDSAGDALRDIFSRLWADGPELGLHIAVSAERVGAMPGALAGLARQRLAFQLSDVSDYGQFGVRRRKMPSPIPGRAIVAGSGRSIQVAVPSDGLRAAVGLIAQAHPAPARPPEPVGALPAEIGIEAITGAVRAAGTPLFLPVAIGESQLQAAGLTLHQGEHALIAGPARSGKSTLLCTAALVMRQAAPGTTIMAVALRPSPLRECEAVSRLVTDPGQLQAAVAETRQPGTPFLLLVDDAEIVEDQGRSLAELLSDHQTPGHVLAAGRADALRSALGHWTTAVRRSRTGVLLNPDPLSDGQLLGAALPRRQSVPPRTGLGYVVEAGQIELAQVARPAGSTQRVS